MEKGRVDTTEMYRVYNKGIGMVAVIAPENLGRLVSLVNEKSYLIGELAQGKGAVILDGLPDRAPKASPKGGSAR